MTSPYSASDEELYFDQFFKGLTADTMDRDCQPMVEALLLSYINQIKSNLVEQGLDVVEDSFEEYVGFVKMRTVQAFSLLQEYLNKHILIIPHGMVCPEDAVHLNSSNKSESQLDEKINQTFKDIIKAKQNLVHIEVRLQELEQLRDFSKEAADLR